MDERTASQGGNGVQEQPPVGQPEATPGSAEGSTPPGTIEQDMVMVFLSYFGIFALIPFLSVKDDAFIRWHARQGLTFLAACIAAAIPLAIVGVILAFLPVIGGLLSGLLWLGYTGGAIALWLVALIKAFGGERWKIPVIGDLSERWGN
jgi:uncharacterized membrane protein